MGLGDHCPRHPTPGYPRDAHTERAPTRSRVGALSAFSVGLDASGAEAVDDAGAELVSGDVVAAVAVTDVQCPGRTQPDFFAQEAPGLAVGDHALHVVAGAGVDLDAAEVSGAVPLHLDPGDLGPVVDVAAGLAGAGVGPGVDVGGGSGFHGVGLSGLGASPCL